VGITGWGIGCGQSGYPGVYTRVAGPTMSSRIQSDVSNLNATFGLPNEPIFGSGALPKGTAPPTNKSSKAANTKKRCKRIHNKRKRRRCIKKHKHHKKT
jgi:secreted trypsin-like serine protease